MLTDRVVRVGGADLTHELDCHVYLVAGGTELALVDAGGGRAPDAILANVRAAGFDPGAIGSILLTHGHGDHAAGAAALAARLPSARLRATALVARWLADGDEMALSIAAGRAAGLYPSDFRLEPCAVDGDLADDTVVTVGDVALRAIDTPGHCDGHVSLLLDEDGRRDLLAGDAIFDRGRVALQPLHDCRLDRLVATLRRLRALPLDGLFAGHGEPVVADAAADVERANAALDRLRLPEPLLP